MALGGAFLAKGSFLTRQFSDQHPSDAPKDISAYFRAKTLSQPTGSQKAKLLNLVDIWAMAKGLGDRQTLSLVSSH